MFAAGTLQLRHRTLHLLNCRAALPPAPQIRGRVKPDGMCLVVGSCAEGALPAAFGDCDDSQPPLHAAESTWRWQAARKFLHAQTVGAATGPATGPRACW